MRYPRVAFWTALTLAAAALLACSDGPGEPVAGVVVASLTSPSTDGAILLRVTGPGFEPPQVAGSGTALYWRQVSESEIVVAVFGAISAGALFRVEVPHHGRIGQYHATVLQVADRNDEERSDLAGYSVTLAVAE
jgi:hypothetical protein